MCKARFGFRTLRALDFCAGKWWPGENWLLRSTFFLSPEAERGFTWKLWTATHTHKHLSLGYLLACSLKSLDQKFQSSWYSANKGAWSTDRMTTYPFFLNLKFIYFNWRLISLQYCSGFWHTLTWISHGCICVPHPENPSHLPSHTIPQGHPSAPALSTLSHAPNLDWWSVSHMVICMFPCYSVKSSHTRLLPQSPKVCSIHLCLFCCLKYMVIVAIFLNSIYIWVNILYWCLAFWLTSLCIIGFSFIHFIRTDSNAFFLIAE